METHLIKEFLTLSETFSFQEAADRLYISPSTLSRHIRIIEEELGAELFHRSSKSVSLTRYGETFLPYAEKMVRLQSEWTLAIDRIRAADKQILRIGSIHSSSQYHVPDLIRHFKEEHPQFEVEVLSGHTHRLTEYLAGDRIDVAFCLAPDPVPHNTQFTPLVEDPFTAILPFSHPLSDRKWIRLEDLRDESFILFPEYTILGFLQRRLCRDAGFEPHILYNTRSVSDILEQVQSAGCVSILTAASNRRCERNSVATADLYQSAPCLFGLLVSEKNTAPLIRTFRDYVQDHPLTVSAR